jgi:TolA-binding protein
VRRRPDPMPPRLLEGEGEVADLLRKVERQARQAPSEAAAWERTLRRLGRDSGRGRLHVGLAAAAGALVGAIALSVALAPSTQLRSGRGPSVAEVRPSVSATKARVTSPRSPSTPTSPQIVPPVPVLPRDAAGAPAQPGSGPRFTAADGTLTAADIPHIQLGRAAVGLPAGHTELLGEADVMLSRGGTARAFATAAAATVDLDVGEVELHVEKRPPEAGHAFEVTAGGYRFTALGTTFRVARANGHVTLSVSEGRVAVSLGTERVTIVTAGGFWAGAIGEPRVRQSAHLTKPASPGHVGSPGGTSWSGALPSSSVAPGAPTPASRVALALSPPSLESSFAPPSWPPSGPPSAPSSVSAGAPSPPRPSPSSFDPALAPRAAAPDKPAPRPAGSGAGALAGSTALKSPARPVAPGRCAGAAIGATPNVRMAPRAQIDCLLGQGRGSELGAEVALYEAARLYRDTLGDTGHAIATLRELRRRFPSGALAAEADLTLAELLPTVGRYREALAASAAVLETQPSPERMAELHLLRGDLLRTGVGDCRAAAAEYAQAAELGPDTAADPASFFAAVCLQKLGDAASARRAFEHYLARPSPRRAAEAVRRLGELDQPTRLHP